MCRNINSGQSNNLDRRRGLAIVSWKKTFLFILFGSCEEQYAYPKILYSQRSKRLESTMRAFAPSKMLIGISSFLKPQPQLKSSCLSRKQKNQQFITTLIRYRWLFLLKKHAEVDLNRKWLFQSKFKDSFLISLKYLLCFVLVFVFALFCFVLFSFCFVFVKLLKLWRNWNG